MSRGLYTIVIEDRHGVPVQEVSFDGGERIVGRFRECDIVLPSENVSRRHARFLLDHDGLFIEDLNSANGVFVNGERIRERAALTDGTVVRIGDYTLRVQCPVGGVRRRVPHIRLVGRNLTVADEVFEVDRPTMVVGRGRDAAIALPDPSVSRVHARLIAQPDGHVLVEDMGSANGTFVNNQRVRIWQLSEGDLLRFGNVEFLVEIPNAETVEGLKVPGRLARWLGAVRQHPFWAIAGGMTVLIAVLLVAVLVLFSPAKETWGPSRLENASSIPVERAPQRDPGSTAGPTNDLFQQAMEAFARRDLDNAARIVDEVLRQRPADPDAVKLSNRIAAERRVWEILRDASSQKDPILATATLVNIPQDTIFRADIQARLRALLPEVERLKAKACRANKVVDCARLSGLVTKGQAILAHP